MKIIFLISLFLMGCKTIDTIDCWSIDGKAMGSCLREKSAKKLCKKHQGLKLYYYNFAECNDGTTFTDEVER